MTGWQQAAIAALPIVVAAGWWWLGRAKREDWQAEMREAHEGLRLARERGDEEAEAFWSLVIEDLERQRDRTHNKEK